ncbi:MAG: DUF106 domain-containing protein [Nitrososphaerota archaeon]|nr:DUF106 domain-containing protein [Nitrososphaerota archaeon]
MSKARRQGGAGSGGSRIITYVLIAAIAILVAYYVVIPDFIPHAPATSGLPGTTSSSATANLNPGTDISGSSVTVTGQGFTARSNVTISFDGAAVPLTNGSNGKTGCGTGGSGALASCTFWVPANSASGAHNVTIVAGATAVQKTFTIPAYTPPVSTVLVTLTSVALGAVTQLVTRRVVDLGAERKMRAEVNAFNKEKREATVAKDKAKLDKLKKRELQVQQEQFKIQRARLKVTAITFVPLLGVYYLMATFLGGYGVIVAYTPLPIPDFAGMTQNPAVFQVSLFWWYFLSSFTFSTMLGRLLHTTT